MSDAIVSCDSAIESGDAGAVSDTALRIGPEFRDRQYARLGLTNGDVVAATATVTPGQQNGFDEDGEDPFAGRTGQGGFQDDPFKSGECV